MKIKTKFMLTTATILLIGTTMMLGWNAYSSYTSTLRDVTTGRVNTLSDTTRNATLSYMAINEAAAMDQYIEAVKKLPAVLEFRIIRSPALEKDLGVKKTRSSKDDIDRQVLKTGREQKLHVNVGHTRGIRRISPIIASKECLDCHASSKEGDVIGALSMTISYQDNINQMMRDLSTTAFIQFIIILLTIGSISVLFNTLIMKPVSKMKAFANQLGDGDLTAHIDIHSHDELGILAVSFNEFVTKIEGMIARIHSSTEQLLAAADAIAGSSQMISDGAQQQSSSFEELSSSVEANAHNAGSVDLITQDMAGKAKETERSVDKTVAAIESIKNDSRRIAAVVDLITEIADQTNLLALNAAIEAARAGELGNGFAVVADEVRRLAVRSSASAKEIKGLINETLNQMSNSVNISKEAEQNTKAIIINIKKISEQIQSVAHATQEQAAAMEQNTAITESNAATSEQLAASAETMSAQAKALGEMINQFKISKKI